MRKALVLVSVCVASSAFAQTVQNFFVRKDGLTSIAGYMINVAGGVAGDIGSGTGCMGSSGKMYSAIMVDPTNVSPPRSIVLVTNVPLSTGVDYFLKPNSESTVTCGGVEYLKGAASKTPWKRYSEDTDPGARVLATMTADPTGNNAWVYGGDNASGTQTSTFYKYDGSTGTWTLKNSSKQPTAKGVSLASNGTYVFKHGGLATSMRNDTAYYTISSNSWTSCSCKKVGTNCPKARALSGHAWDQSRNYMVEFGGYLGTSGSTYHDDETWTLNASCAWTKQTPSTKPSAREGACAAYVPSHTNGDGDSITMNKVVLFGGGDNSTVNNDMWAWDGSNWGQITLTNAPVALYYAGCGWNTADSSNPRFAITGGVTTTGWSPNYDSYYCKFTSSTAATCEKETNPVSTADKPTRGPACAYIAGTGNTVCFGGSNNSGTAQDRVFRSRVY